MGRSDRVVAELSGAMSGLHLMPPSQRGGSAPRHFADGDGRRFRPRTVAFDRFLGRAKVPVLR